MYARWFGSNARAVSMVDGELFDKVVRIARVMRKNPKAMGGMQVSSGLTLRSAQGILSGADSLS